MTRARILVVDEECWTEPPLKRSLSMVGYHVRADGRESALSHLDSWRPHLLFIDRSAPSRDGLELCRRIRARTHVPIVVLAKDLSEADRIEALDSGADDVVTKPVGMSELLARTRALLRRASGHEMAALDCGGFRIDFRKRRCRSTAPSLDSRPRNCRCWPTSRIDPTRSSNVLDCSKRRGDLWGSTIPSTCAFLLRSFVEKSKCNPNIRAIWSPKRGSAIGSIRRADRCACAVSPSKAGSSRGGEMWHRICSGAPRETRPLSLHTLRHRHMRRICTWCACIILTLAGSAAAGQGTAKPAASPSAPAREPPDDPHLVLGAGGHVAFGSAPAVALGLDASIEMATQRWSLGIEGRYDFNAGTQTSRGAGVRSTLAGAAAVPCLRTRALWLCAVVLVSRVATEGSDEGGPTFRDASLFLGLGVRPAVHVGLPLNFALRIGGEVLVHPIPYELSSNDRRLFKSEPVSMTLGPTLVRAF